MTPGQCSAAYPLPAKPGFNPDYACRNGFPLTGACLGTAGTPVCMKEELCGRLYEHCGGWPRGLAHRRARTALEPQP